MQAGTTYRLIMRRGPQVDRAFPILKDVVTIGRDAANDIVIADPEVSRHHSRIVRQANGVVTLEDLGSTNGTYLNGARLAAPQVLAPGDTVGLGETVVLQFQSTAGDAGATVATPRGAYPADVAEPAQVYVPPQPARAEAPAPGPVQIYPQGGGAYAAPEPEEAAPPRRSANVRNYLLAGCGCLLLLCVLCVVAVYVGDTFLGAQFWTMPPMSWVLDLLRTLGLQGLYGG